jgi:phosphoglycerate dehydrogenase-like enzyme
MPTFTIYCNAHLNPAAEAHLIDGAKPHRLIIAKTRAGNLDAGQTDPDLAHADIAFGQPDPSQVIALNNLRWIQLSSAGYTRFDTPEMRRALPARGCILTNSSSVYNEPCSQHILSLILANARELPTAIANQLGPHAWPTKPIRIKSQLLTGQTALILSFGAIARRLVELLTPLHMNLIAVRQTPRGDEPIPVHAITDLDRLLPAADHIINILPASASTEGLIDAKKFALMKPGAVFYNIGRGTTIDQSALQRALETGKLSAAYLDVTDPEPLPPNHPLWQLPNCTITPHTAGGHSDEFERLAKHFIENLRKFEASQPLRDRVM